MTAQRSVGRFCSVVTNDLASLAAVDAADLGIGAEVFVLSNARSYRLSPLVLATASPVAVAALGAVGTWIQENAAADQSYFIYSTSQSATTATVVNTWHALPSAASGYQADSAKAFWSLNTTTGIITYNGPTAVFLVQANVSFLGSESNQGWEFSVTRNSALNGTTFTDALSGRTDTDTPGFGFCSVLSKAIIVPAGTTYQTVLRCLSGPTSSFRIEKYQLSFQLLPG